MKAKGKKAAALLAQAQEAVKGSRLEQALSLIDQALRRDPRSVAARTMRLAALVSLGRYTDAVAAGKRALAAAPREPAVLINLATAHLHLGEADEAAAAAAKATRLAPGMVQGRVVLAKALNRAGRFDEALQALEGAAGPLPSGAIRTRFEALAALERWEEALAECDRLLSTAPGDSDVMAHRAGALLQLGRAEEAEKAAAHALDAAPSNFQALFNRAAALSAQGRYGLADEVFTRALRAEPAAFESRFRQHFGDTFVADRAPPPRDARRYHFGLLYWPLTRCDWQDYEGRVAQIRAMVGVGETAAVSPFHAMHLFDDPELQYRAARHRSEGYERWAAGMAPLPDAPDEGGPLRIGYLSADFRNHPTAHLMASVFACHDRERVRVHAYSIGPDDGSAYRERIARDADRFVDLGELTNREAAERIRADGIQVLVDLMGHTDLARPEILALRPAPVQAAYLGYPGTTGAGFIDYIIADRTVLPEENARWFSETPVYLPHCYQINDRWQPIAETGVTRVDEGLPEDGVVFCCFNEPRKIEPVIFASWMRILAAVPDAVLWLMAADPVARENLRAAAVRNGVAADRLVFAERRSKDVHLERLGLADLVLDTRICGAHTTATDALWMGVPVVTCPGRAFAARVGASLLTAAGLGELVVSDLEGYEALAIELARNADRRQILHRHLKGAREAAPLFDTRQTVRGLEAAYEAMWAARDEEIRTPIDL